MHTDASSELAQKGTDFCPIMRVLLGLLLAPYYFLKNLQGDVIAITNSKGNVVARYTYDAWGVCTILSDSTGMIANVNPYRYRGYYYDAENAKYYLQSRYYDANVGRFVNADAAEYLMISISTNCHNLAAYCMNNPIKLSDPWGNVGLLTGLIVSSFMALCAAIMLLLAWMCDPTFLKVWTSFCASVGNGLAWIGAEIVNGGKAAWNWTKKQVKAATSAIATFIIIARADSIIRTNVREKSKNRYWTATLRTNYVDLGRPISYGTAVSEVSRGRNVFTVTKAEAKSVAKAAYSNKTPVGPEIDKGKEKSLGYYYHYHVYQRRKKGHVFFLFW